MNNGLAGWIYPLGAIEKKICMYSAWEISDQFSDTESDANECMRKEFRVLSLCLRTEKLNPWQGCTSDIDGTLTTFVESFVTNSDSTELWEWGPVLRIVNETLEKTGQSQT